MNSFCYFYCKIRKTYCLLLFPCSINTLSLKMYIFYCFYVQSLRVRYYLRRIFADFLVRSNYCFVIYFLISSSFSILYAVFLLIERLVSAKTCLYVSFEFLRINRRRVFRLWRDSFCRRLERGSMVSSWRCELRRRVNLMVSGIKNVLQAISAVPRSMVA